MKAAPIPGTEGKTPSAPSYPSNVHRKTPLNAATIIDMECVVSGLYPAHRIIRSGTKTPPRPYTAKTTNWNTESPPGTYKPPIEIKVAKDATAIVTCFVVYGLDSTQV